MRRMQEHPLRHVITTEEYMRMGQARVFGSQARLELMEGEIVEMPPIGSAHAAVVNALAAVLARAGERAIVSVQNPLVIGERSVPQPDIVLLRPRLDRYFDKHPAAADAFLLVEVSDSTLNFDMDVKVPLYATAGIAELWIVDIEQRAMHVFRQPDRGTYRVRSIAAYDHTVHVAALSGLVIAVAELFPRES